jgi:hypothetical protein
MCLLRGTDWVFKRDTGLSSCPKSLWTISRGMRCDFFEVQIQCPINGRVRSEKFALKFDEKNFRLVILKTLTLMAVIVIFVLAEERNFVFTFIGYN